MQKALQIFIWRAKDGVNRPQERLRDQRGANAVDKHNLAQSCISITQVKQAGHADGGHQVLVLATSTQAVGADIRLWQGEDVAVTLGVKSSESDFHVGVREELIIEGAATGEVDFKVSRDVDRAATDTNAA